MVIAAQLPLTLRATKLRLWWMGNPYANSSRVETKLHVIYSPWLLKSKNLLVKLAVLHRCSPLPRILTEPTENPDGPKIVDRQAVREVRLPVNELLHFIAQLEAFKLSYSLAVDTPDAVMVMVAVPGERWEIEFGQDGQVECEVFVSRSGVESDLRSELFSRFSN
jgi:hypothetical protein